MLLETLATARDLGRLQEIAGVLVRHGLGDLVRRIGLAALLERAGRAVHWNPAAGLSSITPQEHARSALEELGPTFVKFGQILAGRRDLLPHEWITEFERLHENVRPVPFAEICAQLEEDLGADPRTLFRDLAAEPLASASIAQVHTARLSDGSPVALKVRRPGIEAIVAADLRLLARLAEIAEREWPELANYQPTRLVRQLARALRGELDLRQEAANAKRLAKALRSESAVVVPRIHEQFTRERLCVQEYFPGPSLGEWIASGSPPPPSGSAVAAIGARAVLQLVFVAGQFHADPHPGNMILLRADDSFRIGLIDFGMVGRLSAERRAELLDLLTGLVERDEEALADVLLEWTRSTTCDLAELRADCAALVDRYHDSTLAQIDIAGVLRDVAQLLRQNALVLPNDLALLLKVLLTLDGLGRALDPAFVLSAHAEPFLRRLARRRALPHAALLRGGRGAWRFARLVPREVARIARRLRADGVRVSAELPQLDRFGARIERSANRVTVGLVVAALIVGTSVASTVEGGPRLWGLPALGVLGFASSVCVGVWLLASVLRSPRR